MKALEILKEIKNVENDYDHLKTHKFDEAIKELEDLANENKSLVKTLKKYNEEMIELRKENQELKNATNNHKRIGR